MITEVKDMIATVKKMNARQGARQVLNLALIVCSAVMIWKTLVVVSGSESPVVVVLSGSMEPAFYRGDILFLWMGSAPFRVGEIVVFKVKDRDIPIIHRIIAVHETKDGKQEMLTKGDNNHGDDRAGGIYNPGQLWITEDDVMGRAEAFLPYIGMVTIALTDYPMIKYVVLGIMGIFVLTGKE